jgi:hypothetical protein
MRDERLFARTFQPKKSLLSRKPGTDTWKSWRAFLSAIFGLPMDAEGRALYEKHTGRTDIPNKQAREVFLIAGRRSGKSVVCSLIAVFLACFVDYSADLAPGETGTVMILGADRRQCRVIFNYVKALLHVPMLKKMVAAELKESIRLTNGITIEVHTSSYKSVRGVTLVAAVCDELAFWQDENSANPDTAVFEALRPATLTIPNAMIVGVSSPYAKRGVLFEAHKTYFGKNSADTLVWQADSRSMNPSLPESVIAAAYVKDPASARAEFGGLFREDVEAFLSLETIEARTIKGRHELPYDPTKTYYGFTDPSGGVSDSFAMAIGHHEHGVAVLDLMREAKAPLSPATVTAEFAAVFKSYGIGEIVGDRYAGEWPREEFQKHGVTYKVAEKSKSELYVTLLPSLMSGTVQLLDSARLAAQLTGLERRPGRSHDAIDHAPNSHDDLANSVAGALCEVLAWNVTGSLGVLDWAKKIAKDVAIGLRDMYGQLINPPAPKAISVAVAKPVEMRVDNFRTWLDTSKAPPCPACGATCTVYNELRKIRCNQCQAVDGVALPEGLPADRIHCGVALSIVFGMYRCQQCHKRWPLNGSDSSPKNGMSRAQFDARNSMDSKISRTFGRFG